MFIVNDVGTDGAKTLADAFKTNTTLTTLNLEGIFFFFAALVC